jgi:hypothetical protein
MELFYGVLRLSTNLIAIDLSVPITGRKFFSCQSYLDLRNSCILTQYFLRLWWKIISWNVTIPRVRIGTAAFYGELPASGLR